MQQQVLSKPNYLRNLYTLNCDTIYIIYITLIPSSMILFDF